jgi:ATP-binding cassette, subfamily D (ALD), member 3
VAFFDGAARERGLVDSTFGLLMRHARSMSYFKSASSFMDSLVTKYGATVVGFTLLAQPFMPVHQPDGSVRRPVAGIVHTDQEISTLYYSSGRMLLNMAAAAGRLVGAGREFTQLAGHTKRVADLLEVLEDLEEGHYYRTMVVGSRVTAMVAACGEQGEAKPLKEYEPAPAATRVKLRHSYGTVVVAGSSRPDPTRLPRITSHAELGSAGSALIRFDHCPVVTPAGDVLLESLSMTVPTGCNVLVAGPNGSGKSSMFRVLAGLWPLYGGTLTRPPLDELVYVPQSSYMPLGTLRECMTYPLSAKEAADLGITDAMFQQLLRDVRLEALAEREGLDSVRPWDDVLSGGERQRLSFARVFLRRPSYAIVDEATSQVSVDVEAALYDKCRELGITLFTVSHRRSLWRFHEKILFFDGHGGYEFRDITPEEKDAAAVPTKRVVFGS